MFPGQVGHVIPPACSESVPGSPSTVVECLLDSSRDAQTTLTGSFQLQWAATQKFLSDVQAPHTVPKCAARHPTEKNNFGCLYLWSHFLGSYYACVDWCHLERRSGVKKKALPSYIAPSSPWQSSTRCASLPVPHKSANSSSNLLSPVNKTLKESTSFGGEVARKPKGAIHQAECCGLSPGGADSHPNGSMAEKKIFSHPMVATYWLDLFFEICHVTLQYHKDH